MSVLVTDEARVQQYNPLRHEVVDRSHLRRLQPVFESCAHRMAATLSAGLRRPVRLSAGELEEGPWEQFRAEMGESTFIATALVVDLEERVALHVPSETALSLVEVQFGGDGQTDAGRPQLTDLEFSMVGAILGNMFTALRAGLETVIDINVSLLQRHRNGHYVRMARPGEACFRLELSASIGDGRPRSLWLYFPVATVRTMIDTVQTQEDEDRPEIEAGSPNVERRLSEVPVDIEVAYPAVAMSATEVLSMRPSTVIHLGLAKDEDVELDILIDRTRIARGFLVTQGKRAGCTVTRWERRTT